MRNRLLSAVCGGAGRCEVATGTVYIANNTVGFDQLTAVVADWSPERAAAI
ncbi:hypothetical protein AB4305_33615 [Nocardia sp. 2YAB30]|uniref:hypothetical protein n=1 Tax=Nocardia sp. 2YAB30 TaxID=3233022 RepID=UPI003F969EE4